MNYTNKCKEILLDVIGSEDMDISKIRLASVAKQLETSRRTLQRRLKEEAITYFEILDGVRSSKVKEILLKNNVKVTAQLLGFSDRTSFNNAFKRWYKMSPRYFKYLEKLDQCVKAVNKQNNGVI